MDRDQEKRSPVGSTSSPTNIEARSDNATDSTLVAMDMDTTMVMSEQATTSWTSISEQEESNVLAESQTTADSSGRVRSFQTPHRLLRLLSRAPAGWDVPNTAQQRRAVMTKANQQLEEAELELKEAMRRAVTTRPPQNPTAEFERQLALMRHSPKRAVPPSRHFSFPQRHVHMSPASFDTDDETRSELSYHSDTDFSLLDWRSRAGSEVGDSIGTAMEHLSVTSSPRPTTEFSQAEGTGNTAEEEEVASQASWPLSLSDQASHHISPKHAAPLVDDTLQPNLTEPVAMHPEQDATDVLPTQAPTITTTTSITTTTAPIVTPEHMLEDDDGDELVTDWAMVDPIDEPLRSDSLSPVIPVIRIHDHVSDHAPTPSPPPEPPVSTRHLRNRSGAPKATIPKRLAKQLFTAFSKSKVDPDVTEKLLDASDLFFDQLAYDVQSCTVGRNVTVADMVLLMQKQGLINDKQSLEALAHQYLPRELWDILCTSALYGNTVYPDDRQ